MRRPILTASSRTATWLVTCLLAVDAAYWILTAATWPESPEAPGASNRAPPLTNLPKGDIARLLGGAATTANAGPEDSHFQLRGVVAGPGQRGAAVISVNGTPRTYALGDKVAEGWVLLTLSAGEATLAREVGPSDNAASFGAVTLQLHVPREHNPARPPIRPLPR